MIVTNDVNAAHWAVENGLLLEFAQAHALILKQNRVSLRTVALRRRRKECRTMSKRSGQSGSVRLVGSRWVGRYWRDVSGKSKREHPSVVLGEKSEMTKPEAKRKLMDIIAAEGVNTPRHLEKALKPAVTFNSIADRWEAVKLPTLFTSSRFIIPLQLKKHIRPFFGSMAIEDIRTGTVNEWIRSLGAKGLEPKTIVNCWKSFRAVVNWHLKQLDKPKVSWYPDLPDHEQRWFTQEEINRIVDAAPGQYNMLFRLAGFTGLRCGELCGLRVEDCKMDDGFVEVRRSVWEGHEGDNKTRAGRRNVFLDSVTVEMLRAYIGTRTMGRLFQSSRGTPLVNREICRLVLYPVCKLLGIVPGGTHAFRHGRVSHMQASGLPGDFIKNQIGHSSLRITSDYTHFAHQQSRDMAEQLLRCTQSGKLYSLPN
jgi:integrase